MKEPEINKISNNILNFLLLHYYLFAMCYVPFNKHKRVFSGPSIVFLVSAGQQMPSWLEVEEAHGDMTPPALQGALQNQTSLHQFAALQSYLGIFGHGFHTHTKKNHLLSFFDLMYS